MGRRKPPEHPPVHRTDRLRSNLTGSKREAVSELLRAWRRGAVLLAREQWRLFFETGRFNRDHDVDKVTFAAVIGAATRVQMCRYQVVGQLQGWTSNRHNEFRAQIEASNLPPGVRHMLHSINRRYAWFQRGDLVMADGQAIPPDVRSLARTIMRRVMARHRRPDLRRISMRLNHRAAALAKPVAATQSGAVGWWIRLSTMTKGKPISIPLLTYSYHENRKGRVVGGVQVNERGGDLTFGVVTDMGEPCAASRAQYAGEDALAIDFGLLTLFATSEGQLLGQNWLARLKRYDRMLSSIAAGQQRAGRKPRDSKRYRALVQDLRGFLRTEIGRVLNRLVKERRPAELVLERLDFRNPGLSRRLNAILRNCGRAIIKAKLQDLCDRFGIAVTEVNPAYTSQACSACGYVDKRNRRTRQGFSCLWCGHQVHADLNAAANVRTRRARPHGWLFQGKAAILAELVRGFGERKVMALRHGRTGDQGASADPRLTNPYFGGARSGTVRSTGAARPPNRLGRQALGAS
jgi:putative transposase